MLNQDKFYSDTNVAIVYLAIVVIIVIISTIKNKYFTQKEKNQ